MREQQQFEAAATEQTYIPREPLSEDGKEGIILALKFAFPKLRNLYTRPDLSPGKDPGDAFVDVDQNHEPRFWCTATPLGRRHKNGNTKTVAAGGRLVGVEANASPLVKKPGIGQA